MGGVSLQHTMPLCSQPCEGPSAPPILSWTLRGGCLGALSRGPESVGGGVCWHLFSSTQLQVPCAIRLLSGSLLLPGLHKGVQGSPELSASPYLPPSWGSEPEPRRPPRQPPPSDCCHLSHARGEWEGPPRQRRAPARGQTPGSSLCCRGLSPASPHLGQPPPPLQDREPELEAQKQEADATRQREVLRQEGRTTSSQLRLRTPP